MSRGRITQDSGILSFNSLWVLKLHLMKEIFIFLQAGTINPLSSNSD